MKRRVYADNAATTKLCEEAFEKMLPYFKESYGNASGVYEEGILARQGVNEARHTIAECLGAYDREIIFTGGGSESDNLALIGVMEALKDKGRHLITTNIEHHAVLESCKYLEEHGFRVTFVKAGPNGIVNPKDIEEAICEDTVLISVMYANNELGTLQPIEEIGKIAARHKILFHTDAVQACGKIKINPEKLHIDLLSASAHKFNGPKGIGFLYVKRDTPIKGYIHGGSQERGLRAGTENVPAIVGMGEALKVSLEKAKEREDYERKIRDTLWEDIKDLKGIVRNGDTINVLPGILNVSVEGIEGSSALISLDMKGVAASSGSACAQSLEAPSHVLTAIGKTEEEARSSVRFSLNHENTVEDAEYIAKAFKETVEYLQSMRNI